MEEQKPKSDEKSPNIISLSDEAFGKWKSRIRASKDLIDALKPEWDANQDRYLLRKMGRHPSEVIVPKDFAFVEQKKSQLFFQTPKIMLEAQLPGLEQATPIFESVVNHYLGADGVNVLAAVDEVVSDALCPSGVFAVKIGYEATIEGTKQVQVGMQPDPNWVAPEQEAVGAVLGLNPPPQPPMVPQMVDVPNIIHQRYIFERISPAKVLIPADFVGSLFDKAAYLGFEFLMDIEIAKRAFNLPEDFDSFVNEDDRLIGEKAKEEYGGKRKKVRGWEIYYKAAIFDPDVKHPEKQRLLIIIDGMDKPAVHKDSPYQQINEDGTIGGMPGYPVHVGALRYVSDMAIPPSDASMSRFQVEEVSKGRTTMKYQRERNVPMRMVDLTEIGGPAGLAKLEKNIWQAFIPVESLDPNKPPIAVVAQTHFPQENYQFDNIATRDMEEVWALGANPTGALNPTNRTATELALAQNSSGTRLGKERNKLIAWFVRGVEKLAALIQMFADEQDYVSITGPDGAKRIATWDKTVIQGKYAFDIKPNSFAPVDAAADRAEFLQFYNLMANSPFVNRLELESELARKFGMDPTKMIRQPEPPVEKPEEPKVTVTIDEDALNPNNPAFAVVIEILKAKGVNIAPSAIEAAQKAAAHVSAGVSGMLPVSESGQPPEGGGMPPQGGPGGMPPGGPQESVTPATPVSKHQDDRSGERSGPKPGGLVRLNQ